MDKKQEKQLIMADIDALSAKLAQSSGVLAAIQQVGMNSEGFDINHAEVMNCIWLVDDLIGQALTVITPPHAQRNQMFVG